MKLSEMGCSQLFLFSAGYRGFQGPGGSHVHLGPPIISVKMTPIVESDVMAFRYVREVSETNFEKHRQLVRFCAMKRYIILAN